MSFSNREDCKKAVVAGTDVAFCLSRNGSRSVVEVFCSSAELAEAIAESFDQTQSEPRITKQKDVWKVTYSDTFHFYTLENMLSLLKEVFEEDDKL